MNEKWVFLDGVFHKENDASIPVTDRGFLFGDGMFTTMRVHEGKGELLDAHFNRLCYQAATLQFDWIPFDRSAIAELVDRNQASIGTWRLKMIVTVKEDQGVRTVGHRLMMMEKVQDLSFVPCSLSLFPYSIETPLAHIKNLSYLEHHFVRNFARQQGMDDAIVCTKEGVILETGCSNLFWIDQNKCFIPDLKLPYLKGVFLSSFLSHLSFPVAYVKATIDELPLTAHLYICNALTHIRPILSVGSLNFDRHDRYEEILRRATVQTLQ